MSAKTIDGKALAAEKRAAVSERVRRHLGEGGRRPALATVLVGDDPASHVYVRNKHLACEEVGIESVHHGLRSDATEAEVVELVEGLGRDPEIDGILVQLPLPDRIDPDAVIAAIDPAKDVDGLTPVNAGRLALGNPGLVPCTPSGVIAMLDAEGIEIEGAEAVVIGRSALVGRPLALLMLNRSATVTVCHSRTRDLATVTRRAEIVIAALGSPAAIGPEAVGKGAAVIDVGINRTGDGLVGDVEFEAVRERAGAITPVPGGVGPMTIAMLLENTCAASGLNL